MEDQPDKGNGKIVIPWKWREEEGELDLSNPTDLETAKRLIQQGHGYEKGQIELKAVKGELSDKQTQIEYWNGLIEDAKSTGDTSKVQAALEMTGVKITKADKEDDDVIMDASDRKLKELEDKTSRLEAALYNKYTQDTHSQLEVKYSDGKYPEYKRKDVEDYANKKGIREFEDAYWLMNKEDILKAEAKEEKDKDKKHSDKIRKVASKEPGSGDLPPIPPGKYKDYGKATEGWLTDPGITDSLFVDD